MNPTFDNYDLTDLAGAEVIGSPAVRTGRHRMPDVAGEFFQTAPPGAREIDIRGVLTSAVKTTPELAIAELKGKLLALQQLIGAVGTYAGTDGRAYGSAMLSAYSQAGPMEVASADGGVQALAHIEAAVVTQP